MKLAKYKVCICEGSAESTIIDILVDLNCNKKLQKLYRRKLSISRTRALMINITKIWLSNTLESMVKQRKRILENFCGINYLMCSMIKKEQQNFYTVNVIETKRSEYKRLSKSANFELDSCWKGKKNR